MPSVCEPRFSLGECSVDRAVPAFWQQIDRKQMPHRLYHRARHAIFAAIRPCDGYSTAILPCGTQIASECHKDKRSGSRQDFRKCKSTSDKPKFLANSATSKTLTLASLALLPSGVKQMYQAACPAPQTSSLEFHRLRQQLLRVKRQLSRHGCL